MWSDWPCLKPPSIFSHYFQYKNLSINLVGRWALKPVKNMTLRAKHIGQLNKTNFSDQPTLLLHLKSGDGKTNIKFGLILFLYDLPAISSPHYDDEWN